MLTDRWTQFCLNLVVEYHSDPVVNQFASHRSFHYRFKTILDKVALAPPYHSAP
ncbi:hypothetical protein NY406_08810 [Chlorobaculum sp. MV4-Y]|uniref:hypothetical protein n=1 Tax=Chlorobaculum sp. MV4-Y TaxID=2976335 RepID=UPI0021B07542|nr:hypothetical protein [Chlorobaculum sp. MV4-Y]UWX57302.1 hypothetical protein NY406_08810 [Chlorobaculum sp. MV4-Y]